MQGEEEKASFEDKLTPENRQQIAEQILDLGGLLHDEWRAPRKQEDGYYNPRVETTIDEAWVEAHGTNKVDIANKTYAELPIDWQGENKSSAEVAISEVWKAQLDNKKLDEDFVEQSSSVIHGKWIERSGKQDPEDQQKPYVELSEEEKEKDRVIVRKAIEIANSKKSPDDLNPAKEKAMDNELVDSSRQLVERILESSTSDFEQSETKNAAAKVAAELHLRIADELKIPRKTSYEQRISSDKLSEEIKSQIVQLVQEAQQIHFADITDKATLQHENDQLYTQIIALLLEDAHHFSPPRERVRETVSNSVPNDQIGSRLIRESDEDSPNFPPPPDDSAETHVPQVDRVLETSQVSTETGPPKPPPPPPPDASAETHAPRLDRALETSQITTESEPPPPPNENITGITVEQWELGGESEFAPRRMLPVEGTAEEERTEERYQKELGEYNALRKDFLSTPDNLFEDKQNAIEQTVDYYLHLLNECNPNQVEEIVNAFIVDTTKIIKQSPRSENFAQHQIINLNEYQASINDANLLKAREEFVKQINGNREKISNSKEPSGGLSVINWLNSNIRTILNGNSNHQGERGRYSHRRRIYE